MAWIDRLEIVKMAILAELLVAHVTLLGRLRLGGSEFEASPGK
jgi:hypothetical protein